MPSITWLSGPGYKRTKILPASGMAVGGKMTSCLTVLSRRPLNTRFRSRPLGTTSISRTTMSARLTPPARRAESVNLNLPMRLASTVNCAPPTRPDSTATFFAATSSTRANQSSGFNWRLTSPAAPE